MNEELKFLDTKDKRGCLKKCTLGWLHVATVVEKELLALI